MPCPSMTSAASWRPPLLTSTSLPPPPVPPCSGGSLSGREAPWPTTVCGGPLSSSVSRLLRPAHGSLDAQPPISSNSSRVLRPAHGSLDAQPSSSSVNRVSRRAHCSQDIHVHLSRQSGGGASRRIDSRQFRVSSAAMAAGSNSDEDSQSSGRGLDRIPYSASAANDRISSGATAASDTSAVNDGNSGSREDSLREEGNEEASAAPAVGFYSLSATPASDSGTVNDRDTGSGETSLREEGSGPTVPAAGFYSLSEREAQLPVLQGSQFVKPLATLYPKQPKPPCKACQDTGMVACAVCDGRGWLPKGGFQKRNPVSINRIIGSKWTAMERTFGWRHFRVKSKRRTANKEWFVEMVATCDENSQFWVNAQNLKDRARWGMGWLQKSELLVLSPASFQQPAAGQIPTNLWESAPAPGIPDMGIPPPSGVPDPGVLPSSGVPDPGVPPPPPPAAAAANAARLECKACRGSCFVSCKPCEERKKREAREEALRNAQAGKSAAGAKPDSTIVVI